VAHASVPAPNVSGTLSTRTEIARELCVDPQLPGYYARLLNITPARIVGTVKLYSADQVDMIREAIRTRSRGAKAVVSA